MDALSRFRTSFARSAAVAAVVVTAALFVIASLYPASERSSAGPGPKNIRGFIYDSVGNPLAGANVTITETTTAVVQWYDSSEPDGLYSVWFAYTEWDTGHTFQVTAVYGVHSATNSTLADITPQQFVNVTIGSLTIPEFGAFLNSPIAFVSLGLIALVVVFRRRASK